MQTITSARRAAASVPGDTAAVRRRRTRPAALLSAVEVVGAAAAAEEAEAETVATTQRIWASLQHRPVCSIRPQVSVHSLFRLIVSCVYSLCV